MVSSAAESRNDKIPKMISFRTMLLLATLLVCSPTLGAADEASLQAAFEAAVESLGQKDLDRFLQLWHPEAVLFTRNRIHAIDRTQTEDAVWREAFEDLFSRVYSVGYTQQAVEYRVVGDTGLVWGFTRLAVDLRKEAGFDQETRLTAVFVAVDGDWKILHWSDSPLPTGQSPVIR